MFKIISSASIISLALIAGPVLAAPALAADDSQVASRAARDSAIASGRLAAVGVKVVAGIALRPVIRAARDSQAVGRGLRDSGRAMDDSAQPNTQAMADGPLEVSPETVVAQPVPKVPYDRQPDAPQGAPKKDHP